MKLSDIRRIRSVALDLFGALAVYFLFACFFIVAAPPESPLFAYGVAAVILCFGVIWIKQRTTVVTLPLVAEGLWTFNSVTFHTEIPVEQHLLVKKRQGGDEGAERWFEEKFRQLVDREVIVP